MSTGQNLEVGNHALGVIMKALGTILVVLGVAIGLFFLLQDDAQPDSVADESRPAAAPEVVFGMVDDARIQGILRALPGA